MTYKLSCNICQAQGKRSYYWGESHRAFWDRALEHQKALDTLNEEYATVKHHLNHHKDLKPAFSFTVDRQWKSSLERQIGEALLISNSPEDELLNCKTEWGCNPIPRAKILTDLEREKSARNEETAANLNHHTNSDAKTATKPEKFCQSSAKVLTMGRDITSYMVNSSKRTHHTAGATGKLPNAKRKKSNLDPGSPS